MSHQPHIVLILSDQHRSGWMGCAGYPPARTPNLDRLADTGTRFTSSYCASPLCGPSRMSLMTGRYPHRIGMYLNEHTLRSDIPTFAHALGAAGYETVLAGRMHFSGVDQRHGFERRLVGDLNPPFAGGHSASRDAEFFEFARAVRAWTVARSGTCDVQRYDEAVTRGIERFLETRRSRAENRPLLLVAGFFQPHHPFVAPEELVGRAYAHLKKIDDKAQGEEDEHPGAHIVRAEAHAPEDAVRYARAVYLALIEHMDGLVGRLLTTARRQLAGPTLVIYGSDHGEMAGDRGIWGKAVMHEASVGVPLIFAPLEPTATVPGLPIRAGDMARAPASLLDLAPTLAAVGGAPEIPGTDGSDLSPLIADTSRETDTAWKNRPVFSELCLRFSGSDPELSLIRPATRMIRRGPWKLIYYHPDGFSWSAERAARLFNLDQDPMETTNLASEPEYREVRAFLLARVLEDWDPDAVSADATARAHDLRYVREWAEAVGGRTLGRIENWPSEAGTWDFGFPGQPHQDAAPVEKQFDGDT